MKIETAVELKSAHNTIDNMPAIRITAGNKRHIIKLIYHLIKNKETK